MHFFSKKFYILSTEELCLITLNTDAKFEEKLICCFKNDKKLVNIDLSTWKPQQFALLLLLCKVILLLYRGIIFDDTGGWWKIWRKMELWFGKLHEEYGKFWPEHLKVWKLGPWWDPFAQSIKCMSLKLTEELYSWQWGIDLSFQNWHKEFDKFWLEHLEI